MMIVSTNIDVAKPYPAYSRSIGNQIVPILKVLLLFLGSAVRIDLLDNLTPARASGYATSPVRCTQTGLFFGLTGGRRKRSFIPDDFLELKMTVRRKIARLEAL